MGVTAEAGLMFCIGSPDVLHRPARWSTAEWNALAFLGVETIACMRSSSLPVLRRPARWTTQGNPMSRRGQPDVLPGATRYPTWGKSRGFTQYKTNKAEILGIFFNMLFLKVVYIVKSKPRRIKRTKTKVTEILGIFFNMLFYRVKYSVRSKQTNKTQTKAKKVLNFRNIF